MRLLLILFPAILSFPSLSGDQELRSEDLSEFLYAVTDITGHDWIVDYAYDSRTVTIKSVGTIRGSDFGGGLPADNVADYPIRIAFRLTAKPTEERVKSLHALAKSKLELEGRMSQNALGKAGLAKTGHRRLTKTEWKEYVQHAELCREIDSLALPTHAYRSLYFVDVSSWHIDPEENQSDSGNRLLATRDTLFKILTQVK